MCSNFWASPKKNIDLKKAKESFINDFKKVFLLGYVPSHRKHNTGIGKTFEDLMDIQENNLSTADYKGHIELKAQRALTGSMLTLFTKSPSYPPGANSYLRENYGSLDPKFGLKILHTTIKNSKFNDFKGKWGFKLDINRQEEKINLLIKNINTDSIETYSPYWSFSDLKQKINIKCSIIAYITAETRINKNIEEFHFKTAVLLSGLTLESFLNFLEKDIILFDIRIGVYKRGKNYGKTHDHGSGFRIFRKNISKVFDIEVINPELIDNDLINSIPRMTNNREEEKRNTAQKKLIDF